MKNFSRRYFRDCYSSLDQPLNHRVFPLNLEVRFYKEGLFPYTFLSLWVLKDHQYLECHLEQCQRSCYCPQLPIIFHYKAKKCLYLYSWSFKLMFNPNWFIPKNLASVKWFFSCIKSSRVVITFFSRFLGNLKWLLYIYKAVKCHSHLHDQ